jgi:flagellar assembly protein FliH
MSMERSAEIPQIPTVRIIRPGSEDGPGGGRMGGALLSMNLEDIQGVAARLVRDARERVSRLEEESRGLEVRVAERRAELQREDRDLRRAAEEELSQRRAELEAQAAALRDGAAAEGRSAGLAQGQKDGREEGYRSGFEAGYREGREAGYREAHQSEMDRLRGEAEPLAQSLAALVEEFGSRREALLQAAREELLPLALSIARKVIKRELRECPEAVLANVRKAIDLSFRRHGLVIQVHPEDLALVERHVPQLTADFSGLGGLTVKTAEDVGRGGCRVASGSGMVDLRVESQLELIEQALFQGNVRTAGGVPAADAPAVSAGTRPLSCDRPTEGGFSSPPSPPAGGEGVQRKSLEAQGQRARRAVREVEAKP